MDKKVQTKQAAGVADVAHALSLISNVYSPVVFQASINYVADRGTSEEITQLMSVINEGWPLQKQRFRNYGIRHTHNHEYSQMALYLPDALDKLIGKDGISSEDRAELLQIKQEAEQMKQQLKDEGIYAFPRIHPASLSLKEGVLSILQDKWQNTDCKIRQQVLATLQEKYRMEKKAQELPFGATTLNALANLIKNNQYKPIEEDLQPLAQFVVDRIREGDSHIHLFRVMTTRGYKDFADRLLEAMAQIAPELTPTWQSMQHSISAMKRVIAILEAKWKGTGSKPRKKVLAVLKEKYAQEEGGSIEDIIEAAEELLRKIDELQLDYSDIGTYDDDLRRAIKLFRKMG